MKKYSLTLSPHIDSTTKIDVYELTKNGDSLFEAFIEEIEREGNLFADLAKAIRIVEETANLRSYPKTKFRQIDGHSLNCKVYEAKGKALRIYLFHEKGTGRIIVTGGRKTKQTKDIKQVIRTIKDYYDEQSNR